MAYQLHECHRILLREKRRAKKIPAEELSERILKSKGWVAQIERGRIKSIHLEDLKRLLEILDGSDSDETVRKFLEESDPESVNYKLVNHKSFSDVNAEIYASLDFDKALYRYLTDFGNEVRRQMDEAENDKRRYLLLRAIKILSMNIKRVPDLTIVFNSAPLFHLLEDSSLEFSTMQTALDLFDKCRDCAIHESINNSELKFGGENEHIHRRLSASLDLLDKARACLLKLLTNTSSNTEFKDNYNAIIRVARDMCYDILTPRFEFPEIEEDTVLNDTLIGLYLGKLERLREEIASLYSKYKSMEDDYIVHMLEEQRAYALYLLDHLEEVEPEDSLPPETEESVSPEHQKE